MITHTGSLKMSSKRRFYCDDETGETITYRVSAETGEPLMENNSSKLIEANHNKRIYFPKGYNTKTEEFRSLKENIIAGSNTLSYRMLLIPPTLMICPAIGCVLLMFLEIYLHMRCHKQNKTLNNPELYYRSPFHVVTSAFCACCQETNAASKISVMQDKRRDRHYYLRGIVI